MAEGRAKGIKICKHIEKQVISNLTRSLPEMKLQEFSHFKSITLTHLSIKYCSFAQGDTQRRLWAIPQFPEKRGTRLSRTGLN